MVTSDLTAFRLSPQQESVWRAQGSRPALGFICQGLLEMQGPLDRNRLRRAVERIVERHEILRTSFRRLPGMSLPVQVIQDRGEVLWSEPETSGQGEAEVERFLAEGRRSPLPLEDGAALQASLISLGEERHALLLTLPVLAADALSLRVLAHEIAMLYCDAEGTESLPAPLQYADAAESLQEWLGPEDGPGAAFWRQQGSPSLLSVDVAGLAVPETEHRRLPKGPVAGLAHQMEVPVPFLLLAAWSAALWWETGEERRTIAVAHDGRTFDELSRAVGPYARYLPVQSVAGPGTTLGELARSLEAAATTAATWQDAFSLDRLTAGSADGGSVPLWLFGFDSDRTAVLSPAISLRPGFVGLGRFGLRLSALEEDTAVRLDLHYDPSRYDRRQAERLLDRLERLLAAGPAAPVGEIDVLSEAERLEILVEFNDTAAPYPAEATVCDLFEERVHLSPQAPAVAADDGLSLTFAELEARANRLARHLCRLGIGPESRVGIHLEREPEMVVALLAVLKAGGAYVPLDAGHPAERLSFLMQDAGLAVLVTRERLHPTGVDPIRTVRIDAGGTDAEVVSRQAAAPPPRLAGPDNAAYVIYTSGSTGRPKGVVITHRGLVNYLCWARTAYETSPGRGAPVHSPLGFDLTVTSLFVPLLNGAVITLLPEEEGIGTLAEALRARGESVFGLAKVTPAHLGLLRQLTPDGEPPPSAACLVIGGDALWAADIAPWRRQGTKIFNEYGPTETVVGCSVHEVGPESPEAGSVPIGRPISNTRLYVMGPGLRPVPTGVPGELWVGGDGVARGYLGRPGLTAERFVPDPFTLPDRPGGRLYRTGDLVRLGSSGSGLELEFLGRIDDQVKIRGHRVEPGEVAATLCSHPGLRDAAVALHGTGSDRRLVAWIVARDRARRPTATELRRFLAERLPEPMIPATYVQLDVLPLTPNGKLDRRALPDPDRHRDEETPYAPPLTLAEEVLAEIWGQVLGVDRVGIDDPFFSLGGDSIRSLQVFSLAHQRGLTVTLQDLYQRPTIRRLAELARLDGAASAPEPDLTPFALVSPGDRQRLPTGIEDAYPVSQLQMGMLFHTERNPETAVYHVQHSVLMNGRFNPERMQSAIDLLAERHPILRTSFDLASFSEPLQLVHAAVAIPLGVEDLSPLAPEAQRKAVLAWLGESRHHPFDWTRPPLVRFHGHLLGENAFQFTLSLHHAVLDGWSVAVMLSELFRLYLAQLTGGAHLAEPPPSASFKELVALERSLLGSPAAAELWDRYLDGAEPTLIPRKRAGGAEGSGIAIVPAPLSLDVSVSLRRLARAALVPLKSVLLSAHLRALSLLSGRMDICTGLVSHSRPERQDGERVLGMFLNTIPFRLHLAGGTWLELAQATFDAERAVLPFRAFPLPELQRRRGGRPLFETVLNFIHFHAYQSVMEIPGLAAQGSTDYEEINYPFMATFSLSLAPDSPQIGLRLNYHPAELGAGEVQEIGRRYQAILEAMAADPESRYDVPLLSAIERHQMLVEWNDTAAALSGESVLERIAEQVRRTPDAVAVVDEAESLTYAALASAVRRLADRLLALGVGPESLVGVALERSCTLVVALLGILEAGGAYVPIDPDSPRERLALLLADSGVRLLLTEQRLAAGLPPLQARVVCLDEPAAGLGARSAEPPHATPGGAQAAYMIYTSGSTGTPKGVVNTHRGLLNRLLWMQSVYGLTREDRVLQKTPFSFDVSVWEFFWPLMTGARLVVARPGGHRDPAYLAELIVREGITAIHFVPSMLQLFLNEPKAAGCRSLRLVFASGEALPFELQNLFHQRFASSRVELHNLYGPTEAAIDVTAWACRRGSEVARVPIGRPVANTAIRLLGPWLQPVPPGVPGELCIGGVQLARGYFGRPELTADRFIPDPLGEAPGERLYRTGDLARFLPDGALEYLGRIDFQVKIRGVRIEPGEIESVLAGLSGVREAVVVAREDQPGDRRLVAYVVGDVAVEELRRSLRERLPDLMVPAAFVRLLEIPLTSNGKVDRKALPAPEWQSASPSYLAPRTPVEEVLAGIWAELLGLERVGGRDHFFDLGGHSLLVIQVMSRLRSAFDVEMPLRDLFEAPVLTDLAARIERARRSGAVPVAPPLVPVPREAPLPLSFAQQRLWLLDQLEPGSPAYNVPAAVLLTGELDRATLAASFEQVVARHEILRTTFDAAGEEPVQRIAPSGPVPLPLIDLSALPDLRREDEMRTLAFAEARRTFDLQHGPLLRLALLRLAEKEHALLLTLHHIVSDGWSMEILIREITALYSARREERPSPLPPLPVQYADFAVWQRRWMTPQALESQLHYWREHLMGAPLVLELPSDRRRPPVPSGRGGASSLRVPAPKGAAMVSLARREGVTLFMTLLAAFGTLFHRYTGREDLIVGTDVANRDRVETESLIGFFVNQLALRLDLSGDPPFLLLLERVREVALGAYAHKDLPFEKLVEELETQRDLSRNPVFQVALTLQNAPMRAAELQGLSLRPLGSSAGTARFDLSVSAGEAAGGGLSLSTEHSSELFDDTTVTRLLGHLATLLAAAAAEPERRISELPLLPAAERQQALVEWNDSSAELPGGGSTFTALFAACAAVHPDAIAVADQDGALTYRELDQRSGRLAARLAREGVRPGDVIPLLGARSTDFLVAVLGIFKVGAAYLPLDPLHPAARRAQILSVCGAVTVLCDLSTAPLLTPADPGSPAPRLLTIEALLARADLEPVSSPPSGDRSLAYVIYTSGSTGLPKGAMIEHRGLLNHLWAKVSSLGLTAGDVVAQTASQCFDISVWQFLAPLLVGARAHIVPDEVAHDPRRLLDDVDRRGITVLETVPSLLQFILEEISARESGPPPLARLRWLIPTGEELPPALCRRWLALYPGIPLVNAYGPTECSDDVAHGTVRTPPDHHRIRMPIGRPVPNLRLYVLGPGMQPMPARIPGELFVGGAGVGRGYLGVGDGTARTWVPDPFSEIPGERLYRTGDLARWGPDGEIEFLGRIDHQVKLRGHRIEPGEIEALLAAHPEVRAATVTVREDTPGQARLVAYVVPHRAGGDVGDGLHAFASERLPEWMVPSAWVLLDELPLTPNGKLDRKALPAPELVRPCGAGEDATPSGPFEEVLAAIWAEVLGLERVGVHDDFFALGGHSLLATQVVSRLRRACAVELPLRALFEDPTVARLALRIERETGTDDAPPILRVPRDGGLPLSFSQQRLWFLDRLTPGSPLYNVPAAMRLGGGLDAAILGRALSEVTRRHEALCTTFPAVDGEPVQVIAPPSSHPLPVLDLSGLPAAEREEETARRISEEVTRSFDLAAGPLLRTLLLRRAEREHILVLTAHHIVSDGWSTGIFARELSILYHAFSRGEGSPLPELSIQYADFAVWQRQWLSGERLARRLDAWRARLAGAPAALELPTDRPRPATQTFRGGRVPVRLGPVTGLRTLAHGETATLFMALLAAFQTLLSRYSGQSDVIVGTPIAGRDRRELEELIGIFINSLPLRGNLTGSPSFRELLGRSRETALEAYSLQGLPFEKLVEELRPARDLARSPLFQVMLVLQNAPIEPLALPDLDLAWATVESGTAKFEITLNLTEAGELFHGNLEYNADLFDSITAERLLRHLEILLAAAVASPDARVDELPLLTLRERDQLLQEWNDTAAPLPETCVHQLFEEQAARTPEAVAVVAPDGRSLTYRELDHRAGALARRLRSLGVGPETRVALALHRSVEMVFAVLGILKAGGAYVPIDLSYPASRMEFLMDDCQAEVLLTHRGLALPELRVKVFCVEDCEEETPLTPEEAGDGAGPGSLAYVLYTSGSTGSPKGVMVEHRSLTNYLLWALRTYPVADGRGTPVHSPLGFDLTVTSLFLPWLAGRTVFLLPEEPGVDSLAAALAEGGFGLVKLTPAHLDLLAERLPPERAAGASRALVLGGEALTGGQLRLWAEHAPGIRVINEYGPTEATVGCCVHEQAAGDLSAGTVPIGRPIANARLHLLDRCLQPVPVGIPGEICIAGAGLARGYGGRPSQTAERFVPDPLSAEPGARLYRTGDLARRHGNGALEFLDRIDRQLKIRGHRVEPGEVEAVLCRHPSVAQAVVAAWGDGYGDRRLGAWIVPVDDATPDVAELRDHLRAVLPELMVPSAWTVLPALPLTPNGKLDRAALPAPGLPAVAAAYEEPSTAGERVIAEVWRELLSLERVGRHDNFFDLGGHSLLMARVQSRLRDRLGLEIGMVDLFSYPTVASIASWLSQTESAAEASRQRERAARQAEREERGRSRLGQLRQQNRLKGGETR